VGLHHLVKDPAAPSWMSLLVIVCEAEIPPVFATKKQTVINYWRKRPGHGVALFPEYVRPNGDTRSFSMKE